MILKISPRRNGNGSGKHKMKRTSFLTLIGIVLILTLTVVVSARYFYLNSSVDSMKAKVFYFTSDLLDGERHSLAPGSTDVTFTIGNHEDALRYSETDIDYEVKVDGSTPTGTNLTGTLSAGSVNDQTITITGLAPGGEYVVTVKGEGGYHKTLSATIVVPEAEQALYKYLDASNESYVLLTVWSKGVEGDVQIDPPGGVLPDNTDPVMRSAKTDVPFTDSLNFHDSGYASHVYRFFGSGVTVNDFTVTCGTITATEKASE